ncbi:MAG: hypothetical protein LAO51_01385 [Acidobacteriia bacterium]|nr:hypothetical protein [Terriglobia bacterium]
MSDGNSRRDDDRELVREALRRAPGSEEPDVARLLERVPHLMTEARRRRSAPATQDPRPALAERARRAIPRLAFMTAAVVAVAAAAVFLEPEPPANGTGSIDSVILNGSEAGGADSPDVLLDLVTSEETNHG